MSKTIFDLKSATATRDAGWEKYTVSVWANAGTGLSTCLVAFPAGRLWRLKVLILRALVRLYGGSHWIQTVRNIAK